MENKDLKPINTEFVENVTNMYRVSCNDEASLLGQILDLSKEDQLTLEAIVDQKDSDGIYRAAAISTPYRTLGLESLNCLQRNLDPKYEPSIDVRASSLTSVISLEDHLAPEVVKNIRELIQQDPSMDVRWIGDIWK